MKNIFRVSVFGLTLAAVSAVSGFAQTANPCEDAYEVKTAAFEKYKAAVKAPLTLDKAKAGIPIAEEFITKYKACEDAAPVVAHLEKKIPELKKFIVDQEAKAVTDRFNAAVKDPATVNPNDAFTYGKQIIATKPDLALDVALVLASVGYDQSVKNPPVTTYDADTVTHAKMAMQMIESGKMSKNYGAYKYAYLNKDNALAWMNYTIGSIMFYNQKNQKDALPYFYKATQYNSDVKKKAGLYQAIGAWYLEELLKIEKDRTAKIVANSNKDNEETLALFALQKGYAERAADAYARAYKLATDAAYKKELFTKLEALYKIRFENTTGIDAWATAAIAKPLPDPTSAVTPVNLETPATTTTTTTSSTTTTSNPSTTTKPTADTTTTTDTTTKPATDTNKPANTTTKPTTSTKTTTKVSSKSTTKKKGTR